MAIVTVYVALTLDLEGRLFPLDLHLVFMRGRSDVIFAAHNSTAVNANICSLTLLGAGSGEDDVSYDGAVSTGILALGKYGSHDLITYSILKLLAILIHPVREGIHSVLISALGGCLTLEKLIYGINCAHSVIGSDIGIIIA